METRLKWLPNARDTFILELRRKRAAYIEVRFSADQSGFDNLRRILQIMFPNLELELGKVADFEIRVQVRRNRCSGRSGIRIVASPTPILVA